MKKLHVVGLAFISLLISGCSWSSNSSTTSGQNNSSGKAVTFKIASMNDLHGSVENVNSEPGLSKITTYIKNNYSSSDLLLANGDMWQGNGESNLNKGKLVTGWMNKVGFDSMSLGNHDFDWGKETIKANKEVADFPFLSANLYNYESGSVTTHADDLADVSTILNVGDFQVGVIGAIGRDQYTSITSTQVGTLDFVEPYSLIKEESIKLRKAGCEVIIVELHTPQEEDNALTSGMKELAGTDSATGKKYADAVFCGHSHNTRTDYYNSVPYLRGAAYGKAFSEITVSIDTNGNATVKNYKVNSISTSLASDTDCDTFLKAYSDVQNTVLDEKLGKGSQINIDSYVSTETMADVNAKAMYQAASKKGVTDIDLAVVNTARNSLEAGDLTFRDVYRSFPFDNNLVIMTISESDLYGETVKYKNYFYNPNHISAPSQGGTKTYKIAVIDYLGLHQSAKHVYNYFPSMKDVQTFSSEDIYPRNIVKDYFNSITSFNPNDFATYNSDFSYA